MSYRQPPIIEPPTSGGSGGSGTVSYSGASTLASPLIKAAFSDVPATSDSDIMQVSQTNASTSYNTMWLNERGYYRAQQRPGSLFDILITLIGDPLNGGTGNLLQLENLDGSNARQPVGGFSKYGRLLTSLATWAAVTSFDPNTTTRYASTTSSATGAGTIDALGARWVSDDVVQLRGQIAASGTAVAGDVMFVLPAGYAPSKPRTVICGASGGAAVSVEILTSGNVVNRRAGTQSYNISFDGISFPV